VAAECKTCGLCNTGQSRRGGEDSGKLVMACINGSCRVLVESPGELYTRGTAAMNASEVAFE
jgi:hypothetical protein